MKILLVHNYYRSGAPSGEDEVFRAERALLEGNGVEVVAFEKFNDMIDDSTLRKKICVAVDTAWSTSVYRELSALIAKTKPTLAHFHNTFPLISPSAYAACHDHDMPVVQTLHNFRLICPGGLLLRNGKPCEDCLGGSLLPALRHRCYRDSLPATGALVWMIARNRWRGTYRTLVNRYIALTQFAADKLICGGLPADRIEIKPNFLLDPPPRVVKSNKGGFALYVGRLTTEKGVRTLIDAWSYVEGLPLKVLGDGVLRGELAACAKARNLDVEFLGFRPKVEIMSWVSRASMQIIPSGCYEGFPLVVLEAFANGTPVIVSRMGSLAEIVQESRTGIQFESNNPQDLAAKVNGLRINPYALAKYGKNARTEFEQHYTAERNFGQLMSIYANAIAHRAGYRR